MHDGPPNDNAFDFSDEHLVDDLYRRARHDALVSDRAERLAAGVIVRLRRRRRRQRAGLFASAAVLGLATLLLFHAGSRESPRHDATDGGDTLNTAGETVVKTERPIVSRKELLPPPADRRSDKRLSRLFETVRSGTSNAARDAIAEILSSGSEEEIEARLISLGEALDARRGRFDACLEALLASPMASVRQEGLRLLLPASPRRARRELWRELDSDEHDSRKLVGAIVELMPRPQLLAFAREADRQPPARMKRLLAATVETGGESAWTILAALLRASGPDLERIEAAGRLGDPRALPWLSRWLSLGDARGQAAVTAVGRIPGRRSIELLLELHAASVTPALVPQYREVLERALRDRERDVLAVVRERLDAASPARARPAPEALLAVLVDVFPRSAPRELEALLAERAESLRPLVFRALTRLESEAAVEILVRSLRRRSMRTLARQSLARIAGRDLGADPVEWERWARRHSKRASGAPSARLGRPGRGLLLALLDSPPAANRP